MTSAPAPVAILVVDDEDAILETIADFLEDGGYDAVKANSAEEAFGILEQRASDLGGVITDVNLGPNRASGWEVGRRARELSAKIPVIYITGDSGRDWTAWGVPHSVVLQKPFAPADLVVALAGLRKIA